MLLPQGRPDGQDRKVRGPGLLICPQDGRWPAISAPRVPTVNGAASTAYPPGRFGPCRLRTDPGRFCPSGLSSPPRQGRGLPEQASGLVGTVTPPKDLAVTGRAVRITFCCYV